MRVKGFASKNNVERKVERVKELFVVWLFLFLFVCIVSLHSLSRRVVRLFSSLPLSPVSFDLSVSLVFPSISHACNQLKTPDKRW
jgi:hypothetical protein